MKCPCLAYVAALAIWAASSPGQTLGSADSSRRVEIMLPPSVPSERFFVRYVLAGQELGEWLYAPPGVSSFGISIVANGRPATEMKAIMYAPGCALQTLDFKTSKAGTNRYSFLCHPIGNLEVSGVLVRSDRLWQHSVKLEAKYTAPWATLFLGLDSRLSTNITLGEVTGISPEGRFRLVLPDFSQDVPDKGGSSPGEFEIWAKDESTGAIVAKLVPQKSMRTRMGGLKVQGQYPPDLTFTPCAATSAQAHDKIGFAIRPDKSDACDPF